MGESAIAQVRTARTLALVLALGGCSLVNDAGDFRVDTDASVDGGGLDSGADAQVDASLDAATDGGEDGGEDAGEDAATNDGGDAATDAPACTLTLCGFDESDHVLTPDCTGETCGILECEPGWSDCDADPSTGCEVDLLNDVANCGGCSGEESFACEADVSCQNGSCDPYVQASVGAAGTCVVRESGILECWGATTSGEYAPRGTDWAESPTPVSSSLASSGGMHVQAVAAGAVSTCVISDESGEEGRVYCRGEGSRNRLGTGSSSDQNDFVQTMQSDMTTPLPLVRAIDSYTNHTCAIDLADNLWCWGESGSGEAGTLMSDGPTTMIASDVAEVVTSDNSTCYRTNVGGVYCLGSNNAGQLGSGASDSLRTATPQTVVDTSDTPVVAAKLFGGFGEYCALDMSANLLCWGWNHVGSITTVAGRVTRATLVQTSVMSAALPARAICWWDASGAASCRGLRERGAFGDGPSPATSSESVATRAAALDGISDAEAGVNATCGFRDGEVVCWGYSMYGEVPRDSLIESAPAPMVDATGSASTWDQVALGGYRGCGIQAGTVSCWGSGGSGQHGDGSNDSDSAPRPATDVNAFGTALDVAVGGSGNCAAVQGAIAKQLVCWGASNNGSTGGLPNADAAVVSGVEAADVEMGYQHGCALVGDSAPYEVMCWGWNNHGQVALPTSSSEAPTTVEFGGSPLQADALALGAYHTCAIQAVTGQVVCWGYNQYGQLGGGTENADDFAPMLAGLSGAVAIAAGSYHTCAVQNTGALWCWGAGSYRQRDPSSTQHSGLPTLVSLPTGTTAVDVALTTRSSCATLNDSSVYCWGTPWNSQLGSPQSASPTSPLLVPGLSATQVETFGADLAGVHNAHCAGTPGAGFSCWGENTYGKLATDPNVMMPPTVVAR